jgi:translation initiation factor IF-2
MVNVRVFQLARELGLASHDVIEHLRRLGVDAKTASSSIDEDTSDKLKRTLKIDALTARRRRYYGSDEDEAQRENEAQALAARIAAERAERERAAEEARQAAEDRKVRRGRVRRPDRQVERVARPGGESPEPAPALDHPPGAPRLAPRVALPPQEAAVAELAGLELPEEAPLPTPAPPPEAPAPPPPSRLPAPTPVVRQVTRVRGPVRPIAPVLPPTAPVAAAPATEPDAGEVVAPPPPPPLPSPLPPPSRPALRRPLRPIAPPRPAGPHPTSSHTARPQVSAASAPSPRSPHAVTPRRVVGGGLRPTSPIPRRQAPAAPQMAEQAPAGRGPKRRKTRATVVAPVREERPTYSGPLRKISLSEGVTVKELAEKMPDVKSRDIMKLLISRGVMVTVNQPIDPTLATDVSREFGYEANIQSFEEEVVQEQTAESKPEDLVSRWPVVTVMGHVDHGKTSLLDAIRETRVVDDEAGGITQHIGAYQVDVGDRKVVFLDTPGHEAFTLMRARGARVTDVVVLVVAADDGVMPQTLEAIDHAKAAGVPLLVAVNKIDKPGAQPDRVRQQLSDRGLMPEAWGGNTVFVDVSAKKRQNLPELLEMVLLVSDLQELKANPGRPAVGTVLEARLDKGRGPVATVLIQDGTLQVGDTVVAGAVSGKVRALVDDKGRRRQEAAPSTPVEVLGLTALPEPGDHFLAVTDAAKAQSIVGFRQLKLRERAMAASSRIRLEDLGRAIAEGQLKELPLVIKADVQGSVEALADQLTKLPQEKIKLRIIRSGAGAISEGDVLLAAASDAVVIGFNVRPERKASLAAERDEVEIRTYTVIYDAVSDMKKAMEGLLEPTMREVTLGAAEVRDTFKISKVGTIAGCYVSEGRVTRTADVRLLRDNVVIHTGKVASLRRFKDDASEVKIGLECGIGIAGYNDVKPGDVIEFFTTEKVKETL